MLKIISATVNGICCHEMLLNPRYIHHVLGHNFCTNFGMTPLQFLRPLLVQEPVKKDSSPSARELQQRWIGFVMFRIHLISRTVNGGSNIQASMTTWSPYKINIPIWDQYFYMGPVFSHWAHFPIRDPESNMDPYSYTHSLIWNPYRTHFPYETHIPTFLYEICIPTWGPFSYLEFNNLSISYLHLILHTLQFEPYFLETKLFATTIIF